MTVRFRYSLGTVASHRRSYADLTPKGLPIIIHRSQQPNLKRAVSDRIGFGGPDSLYW